MATNYTSLLGFALPTTGELAGTWGTVVNDSITQLVEDSVAGVASVSVTAGNVTLTTTGSGAANQARCAIIIATGTPGTARQIIAPSQSKAYIVINNSDSNVTFKGAATTGHVLKPGDANLLAWNGSDFMDIEQGDVAGPASATDNAVVRFDGTTGKLVQNSAVTIADTSGDIQTSGSIIVGDGTNSLPSITNVGDTNTGIFFPAADTIAFAEGGAEAMRIDSSGNVGIGTTSPNANGKLTVSGNLVFPSAGNGLVDDAGNQIIQRITGGNIDIGNAGWNNVRLYTQSTERMRIDSSGNVGIGTSPSLKFDVKYEGASASGGVYLVRNNTINLRADVTGTTSAQIGTETSHPFLFVTGGTERARISTAGGFSVGTTADPGAGAIYATGNITAYYSDSRLKDVKGNITGALDKVSSLNGVYYTNNDVAAKHGYTAQDLQVGLLAQQVEAVLPEVVKAAPFDLDENGNSKSGENYKTVQYERIIPLLVEAIKELRAEVKALKGE